MANKFGHLLTTPSIEYKKARLTQEGHGGWSRLRPVWPTSLVVTGVNDPDYQGIGNIRFNYGPCKATHCVTNEEAATNSEPGGSAEAKHFRHAFGEITLVLEGTKCMTMENLIAS